MGVYHATSKNARVPIVPDGFLSLGVERRKNNKSRRSYVVWEEKDVAPILALEVVSWTQARTEADIAKQRAEKLLAKLQELGIDADSLD